jgi:nucleoside-diphosphate-sugar epimerase
VSTLIVGCGYLGQRIGARLHDRGERVYGTVRSPNRAVEIAGQGVEPIIADVLDLESLRRLPAIERVFYCVGFDRSAGAAMRTVYVDGLQNVFDSLPNSVSRLVYASSSGVYGQTDGEWVDEGSPTHPQHESGKVCLEAEQLVRTWADSRSGSVSAVILRYVGLYGPDRVVRRAILERAEPLPGDPAKFLNLIHIDDAAVAGVAALETNRVESIYGIADDRPVTRREYYSLMASLLSAPEPRFEPQGPESRESSRDATNKRVSNQRMKRGLGLKLIHADITTGLPAAIRRPNLQSR